MQDGAAIEQWFADTLGLDAASLGKSRVERVIAAAMKRSGITDGSAYRELLAASPEESERCVEEFVVPETWFFRDREPFAFLEGYAQEQWLPSHPDQTLRILSAPCSTGEEPYSIAMTLIGAGFPADRFHLDAADISRKALAVARQALYGRGSFRQPLNATQEAFFHTTPRGRQLTEAVTGAVRFHSANLVTPPFLEGEAPYHIIFCRNIFIYLNRSGRQQLLANLDRLLAPDGLLFTGHSEVGYLQQQGFTAIRHPLSFACRKAGNAPAAAPSPAEPKSRPQRPAPPPAFVAVLPAANATTVADIPAPPREPASPPAAAGSLHAEALALADRGEFDAAAELCRRYLSREHPHPDVYCLLGLIHEAARQPGEAERCYRKALYLDPDHYETLIQASLLYGQQGNGEKALLYRRRAEARERRVDGTDRA